MVAQLALEAVLLRYPAEGGDREEGINELVRMSLIERSRAPDDAEFLSVPLTAALFGLMVYGWLYALRIRPRGTTILPKADVSGQ